MHSQCAAAAAAATTIAVQDRLNNFTVHYARAVQSLGQGLQVPVANIYDALMVPDNWMVSCCVLLLVLKTTTGCSPATL